MLKLRTVKRLTWGEKKAEIHSFIFWFENINYLLKCHFHLKWNKISRIDRFSSVQFSRSVVSDSLRPHESQHTTPPCPSPIPGVHSDSSPSSQWYHPAISSSVVPFSSWLGTINLVKEISMQETVLYKI